MLHSLNVVQLRVSLISKWVMRTHHYSISISSNNEFFILDSKVNKFCEVSFYFMALEDFQKFFLICPQLYNHRYLGGGEVYQLEWSLILEAYVQGLNVLHTYVIYVFFANEYVCSVYPSSKFSQFNVFPILVVQLYWI